jgi:hypothetical protein
MYNYFHRPGLSAIAMLYPLSHQQGFKETALLDDDLRMR